VFQYTTATDVAAPISVRRSALAGREPARTRRGNPDVWHRSISFASCSSPLSRSGGERDFLGGPEHAPPGDGSMGNRVPRLCVGLHQGNLLPCSKDNPLPGLDIPRYRPQPESHVEGIDSYDAPKSQFTELVLQRMTAGAKRHRVAIRRLHSPAGIRARAHMCGLRGGRLAANHTGKLSDKG
jgi:hypothetical protein